MSDTFEADINVVITRATEQGWRHQRTEKNHHQFYGPDGKAIVTVSHLSSDRRGWSNFLADMKRHGYRDSLATLGDFMPAQKPPNGGAKLSVTQYVVDFLSRHPEGVSSADIGAFVRSQRPELGANTHHSTLSQLTSKGTLTRSLGGKYSLATAAVVGNANPVEIHINGAPTKKTFGEMLNETAGEPRNVSEDTLNQDLKLLDAALDALAQIEGVVKRNREVLRQVEALRKMLGVRS